MAKATFIMTDDNLEPIYDKNTGNFDEFESESKAVSAAKTEVKSLGFNREVWVWRLSHVVCTPVTAEPTVETVK